MDGGVLVSAPREKGGRPKSSETPRLHIDDDDKKKRKKCVSFPLEHKLTARYEYFVVEGKPITSFVGSEVDDPAPCPGPGSSGYLAALVAALGEARTVSEGLCANLNQGCPDGQTCKHAVKKLKTEQKLSEKVVGKSRYCYVDTTVTMELACVCKK